MGMSLFSKLVETVVAICLTHAKNEKWNITQNQPKEYLELASADIAFANLHIAYEHGPSSRRLGNWNT